ncbi:MAG: metallophosphoesterase [Candidatus Omnitrophica bacterium]|nr:metallophosphoesterase [Candidatus Omnitrophota bacterium]
MIWLLILIFLASVILFWAFFVEPNWFRLRRVKITGQKKLRKPITILHLSDIHFTGNLGSKRGFFQRLSMLNPDLIFLTGDIIDNSEGIDTAVRTISGLRAHYGTFLVLGNHDYYDYKTVDNIRYHLGLGKTAINRNNVNRFCSELKRIGVHVLINESMKLQVHGNPVLIGGTDDPVTQKIDFEKALHHLSAETLNILLVHHLDALLKLSHHGVDLVFAGHTHGGQIRIPFLGPLVCDSKLPRKYVAGLHTYKDITVFVSRGMGAGRSIFPRFACRPEAIWFEVAP